MRLRPLRRLTMRAALALGFGLTLGLWLFAGFSVTGRLAELRRTTEGISERAFQSQELLSRVQEQVLLGSVSARDHLLYEADPGASAAHLRVVDESYRLAEDALSEYGAGLESETVRAGFLRLRSEIERLGSDVSEVISTHPHAGALDAGSSLAKLVPQRELVLALMDEVRALNFQAFAQQRAAVEVAYQSSQRRALLQFWLVAIATLGIAVFASLYAGRLESRLRHQRALDVEHSGELQRLSARLVTAQEQERRAIARELHDEVGQLLTAIKMELTIAERRIETDGPSDTVLADAKTITDTALGTVRDLSHLLHPALLDDLGLQAVLEWYVRGYGRRHGIHATFRHDELNDRLQPEVESAAYRIVQEALTNVARHASATEVRLSLARRSSSIVLTIEDNGVGFDPAEVEKQSPRRGLGLVGIRERISELLGTFRIESAPGGGTRLIVELPAEARTTDGDELGTEVLRG